MTCDMDGYWTDWSDRDHYWHCEEPALPGGNYCAEHQAAMNEDAEWLAGEVA